MKSIKAKPLDVAAFLQYGYVADIADPANTYRLGSYPCTFHRDMVTMPVKDCTPPAFGSLKVGKRPMVIEDTEFHSSSPELMMPLDDDMVIYVAPANADAVEMDEVVAYLVPKGTLVVLKPGTWHGAPYPVNQDGTVLICLPERAYLNDTKKYFLTEEQKLQIEL